MKIVLRFAAIAMVMAVMFAGMSACSASGDGLLAKTGPQLSRPDEDIITLAMGENMADVSTLVKALQAADLVDTLKGPGPFTVFAPTNAAFAALPPDELDALLQPENKKKLRSVLLYHVHPGDAILASEAHTMVLTTADPGRALNISVDAGTIRVNDAKVIKADIIAKNGVIHWIDKVLMPPS